jgi:hypothetical protein
MALTPLQTNKSQDNRPRSNRLLQLGSEPDVAPSPLRWHVHPNAPYLCEHGRGNYCSYQKLGFSSRIPDRFQRFCAHALIKFDVRRGLVRQGQAWPQRGQRILVVFQRFKNPLYNQLKFCQACKESGTCALSREQLTGFAGDMRFREEVAEFDFSLQKRTKPQLLCCDSCVQRLGVNCCQRHRILSLLTVLAILSTPVHGSSNERASYMVRPRASQTYGVDALVLSSSSLSPSQLKLRRCVSHSLEMDQTETHLSLM